MRVYISSAKNLFLKRQRNAQQDTKTLRSLAGISNLIAKIQIKLGGFTDVFAEITDENELECRSPLATEPESTDNLSPCREKVKPETGNLSTFFIFLCEYSRICGTTIMEMLQIRQDSPVPSCRCRFRQRIWNSRHVRK